MEWELRRQTGSLETKWKREQLAKFVNPGLRKCHTGPIGGDW